MERVTSSGSKSLMSIKMPIKKCDSVYEEILFMKTCVLPRWPSFVKLQKEDDIID